MAAGTVLPEQLRELGLRSGPTSLARERVLPVASPFDRLLPGGALRRGATVSTGGAAATSLALALVAGASQAGSWVAVVGLPSMGLAAAVELGVALDRLVLVPDVPPGSWGAVVAALVGAFDVVLLSGAGPSRAGDGRRLVARARERGSVLVEVATGSSSGGRLAADVRLVASGVSWQGVDRGHGHLRARRLTVEVSGRREADRPRRADLWLPDGHGAIVEVERRASVTSLPVRSRHG